MKKSEFEVTIGYKSVVTVNVKAENEEQAKKMAIDLFNKDRNKWYATKNIQLQDDTFGAYGVTNMDKTWTQLY